MRAGVSPVRDTVAVDVEVSTEALGHGLKIFTAQYFAAVVAIAVVELQRWRHPLVHAEIKITHDDDGGLQPLGQIKRFYRHTEALCGRGGKEQHVFGIAVRGIGRRENVGLLGARGHTGRGSGALHVDQYCRHFGEVGEAQKLAHERHAWTTGSCERAGTVPVGANDHAHGGELVLGLHNGVILLARARVNAQAPTVLFKGIYHRR